MQAVINLSGEGSGLRPLSCQKHIGMMELCGMSIAQHLITFLKKNGISDIVIITGYMENGIREYFKSGEKWDVRIRYAKTFGSDIDLKCHGDILNENFLYISKLVYCDFDLSQIINFHRDRNCFITIITLPGVNDGIVCGRGGRVMRIEEKRMWQSLFGEGGLGMYILNRDVVRFIPSDGTVRLHESVLPALVRAGKGIYSKTIDGTCEVIVDFASYMRSVFNCLDLLKKNGNKGVFVEDGAVVEQGALLEAPCYVGKGAHVHKGAKIGSYTVLGEGCRVKDGASVKRSVISRGCRIEKNVNLRGCILDEGVKMYEGSAAYEQSVVGKDCKIGEAAVIKSFVKIWPEKTIEKGSVISENVMWGQKKKEKIFEGGKIRGIVNSDITPAFCTRLGECVGILNARGEVGISHDGSPSGIMLRDALTAGLLGTGCRVKDFGEQPLPITRRGSGFYMLSGSVCINISDDGGEDAAEITILGKNGFDIDTEEKNKLEDLFEKGDFLYADSKSIAECEYVFEYKIYYLKSIVENKKKPPSNGKVLLNCPAPWGRRLIASAMTDFNIPVSMYHSEKNSVIAFCNAVKNGGFDIGFCVDEKCERLDIVLPGTVIDADTYEALTNLIVMKKYPGAKIYLPSTSSSVIDLLAEKYNATVVRTTSAPVEIMHHMSGEEKYLSDEFVFRFDAVGSVILLMDYLTDGHDINELLEELPPIAMAKTVIDMSEAKITGAITRAQDYPNAENVADGVKITFDKGWVIIVPDMEKEILKVVGESTRADFARELCDICIEKLLARD